MAGFDMHLSIRRRILEQAMGRVRALSSDSSACSTSSSDDELELFEKRCLTGQAALQRLRWRVSLAMFSLGGCFMLLYLCTLHTRIESIATNICVNCVWVHVKVLITEVGFLGVLLSTSLAPLADGVWLTRAVIAGNSVGILAACFLGHRVLTHLEEPQQLPVAKWHLLHAYSIMAILFNLGSVRVLFYRDVDRMQSSMWHLVSVFIFVLLCFKVPISIYVTVSCRVFSPTWWAVFCCALALFFSCSATRRECVKARLNRMFERRCSERAAAGIAGLVGTCTVKEALSEATARFRSIQLANLEFEDIADNTPSPALFWRTQSALLHQCDAFVSHSWHDNSRAKWDALQLWRERHTFKNGQEPTIWFDKCCIDQNNIDRDLRCLPIFLSGCRQLVVFCGPTYLSRLWCIMELFTFAHMSRSVDRIQFIPVVRRDQQQEDMESIVRSIEDFDARSCHCYSAQDKERLLRIIHTAFGSLDEFNKAVQRIFKKVGLQVSLSAAPELHGGKEFRGSEADDLSPASSDEAEPLASGRLAASLSDEG